MRVGCGGGASRRRRRRPCARARGRAPPSPRRAAAPRRPPCCSRPASRRTAPEAVGVPTGRQAGHPNGWSRPPCRSSSVVANFQVTNGGRARPRTSTPGSSRARASSRPSPSTTSRRPHAAARLPAAAGLGSPWAKTTRRTPAATSASLHGPVGPCGCTARPRRWFRARPGRARASASACPAPRWWPFGDRSGRRRRSRSRPGGSGRAVARGRRQLEGARHRRLLGCRDLHVVPPLRVARLRGDGGTTRAARGPRLACASHPTSTVGAGVPPGQPVTGCDRVADF